LLNVGPTAEGIIPEKSVTILKQIGKWKEHVHEAFDHMSPAQGIIDHPGFWPLKEAIIFLSI